MQQRLSACRSAWYNRRHTADAALQSYTARSWPYTDLRQDAGCKQGYSRGRT